MFKDLMNKKVIAHAGIILGSVLIFNSLPQIGTIGEFFQENPIATLALGVTIIIWVTKKTEE